MDSRDAQDFAQRFATAGRRLDADDRLHRFADKDRRQIAKPAAESRLRQVKLLTSGGLKPRQEIEAEQVAEGEGHLTLPMAVDTLAHDLHVRAVAQHPLDHRGDR